MNEFLDYINSHEIVSKEHIAHSKIKEETVYIFSDGSTLSCSESKRDPDLYYTHDNNTYKLKYADGKEKLLSNTYSNTGKLMHQMTSSTEGDWNLLDYSYGSNGTTVGTTKITKEGTTYEVSHYNKNYDLSKTGKDTLNPDDLVSKELRTKEGELIEKRTFENGNLSSYTINEKSSSGETIEKTYTFNAGELRAIVESLDGSKRSLTNTLISISGLCDSMSGTVGSEDSGLSVTLSKLGDLCISCENLIDRLLSNLGEDINTYISKSISNEQGTVTSLGEINASIDDIADILGAIS